MKTYLVEFPYALDDEYYYDYGNEEYEEEYDDEIVRKIAHLEKKN